MASIRTRLRHARTSERGAELIELAVALPILLLLIGGVIDFAVMFQRLEVVTNAAREGARLGILPDYQIGDIQNRVTNYLNASGLKTDAASMPAAPAVSYSTTVLPSGASVQVVTVTIQYPHQFLILSPIAAIFGGLGNITLTGTSTMRREVAATP